MPGTHRRVRAGARRRIAHAAGHRGAAALVRETDTSTQADGAAVSLWPDESEQYANLIFSVPGIPNPSPTHELWSGTYNGAASSLWRKLAGQSTQVFPGNVGSSSIDGFSLGGASTTGVSGYGFTHALVAEVLWYQGLLSDADRTAVLNYLAAKYALN